MLVTYTRTRARFVEMANEMALKNVMIKILITTMDAVTNVLLKTIIFAMAIRLIFVANHVEMELKNQVISFKHRISYN
jgi:hypothetical protein